MASIERRTVQGGERYRVRFRHQNRNMAESFISEDAATQFIKLLDALGPTLALEHIRDENTRADAWQLVPWVRHHIEHLSGITDGTRNGYLSYLPSDFEPNFDGIPLDALDRDSIKAWVNWMHKERGLAGKSIRNRHSLMSNACEAAVRAGHMNANPCVGVRLPRSLEQDHIYLDRAEFQALFDATPGHYQPLVFTMVATGMRWGEITALQIKHLNPARHSIRIEQAWKPTGVGAQVELGPPKSKKSRRTIAAPQQVFDLIAPLVEGGQPDMFVFTNTAGEPIKKSTFYRNVWVPARAALAGDKIERVKNPITGRWQAQVIEQGQGKRPRVHDLRHTFASWAIQANVPLTVLQRQMGHESITTTSDVYGHLARSDFDALANLTAQNLPTVEARPLTINA